jgi:phosphatidylglycerol:prolipoprotein diacylglycerol transferase
VFLHEGRRKAMDRDPLLQMLVWVLASGYVGARLFHVVLYEWEAYAAQPLRILDVGAGGLSVYGALVGGTLTVAVYARRKGLAFWDLADAAVVGIAAGEIVGRVGCAIAGDVAGVATDGSWGLVYWNPNASIPPDLLGVPTFPAPVAMQVWDLGLLILLVVLRKRMQPAGALFLIGMIVYSAGRFIVSMWQPEKSLLWGLKPTQAVAVGVVGVAMLALWRLKGRVPRAARL